MSRETWEGVLMQKTLWWFAVLALLAAPGCRKPETPPPITVAQGNAAPSPAAPSPVAPSPAAPSPAAPSPAQPGKSAAGRQQAKQAKPRASSKASPRQRPPRRGTQPLFIIGRNKNANVVHYDAQLTADGKLDPKGPVIAYWVMLAQDGKRTSLSWIEKKMAYGFKVKPDPSVNGYQMTIVAATQRSIAVKTVGSAVRAEIVIDGRPAILEKMYIDASGGLRPTVHSLELYGRDVQTLEKRYEKVIPKK
jgi:hypothetical protein